MIQAVIDQKVSEHFTVSDSNGNLISGIDSTAFTVYIYNPSDNEVSAVVDSSITELGNGNYKLEFTPNALGIWYILVTHTVYFPWGKTDDVQVFTTDFNEIYVDVRRILGLVHHNMYIDNPTYDSFGNMISARLRIYTDAASVGTDNNVIETYLITANGTAPGQFDYWQQIKV